MFFICLSFSNDHSPLWITDPNTPFQFNVKKFIPPSNDYIINNVCAYFDTYINSIGNISWNNGNGSVYSDSNVYTGIASIDGDVTCFQTSCINDVFIGYEGPFPGIGIIMYQLEITSDIGSHYWGSGTPNAGEFNFHCSPGYCLSTLMVSSTMFLDGIYLECVPAPPTKYYISFTIFDKYTHDQIYILQI